MDFADYFWLIFVAVLFGGDVIMATVFKKTFTRPLPEGAELSTRKVLRELLLLRLITKLTALHLLLPILRTYAKLLL